MAGNRVSQFNRYSAIAQAEAAPRDQKPVIPDANAPVTQIARVFAFQSYFDDTLLQNALLAQNRNQPIVDSTAKEEQIPGYALGLSPSSQTPVAVQFKVGGQPTSSQAVILKPGEVIRPHGLPRGMPSGSFSGFVWGLPFGWLGGGMATLKVFQTPDADVAWPGNQEIIFHRQRMKITDAAGFPADAPLNWPQRFPWTQAIQGSNAIPQQGKPLVAVEPTKVLMRLRLDNLATAATMRMVFQNTNDLDLLSTGVLTGTPVSFVEVIWGTYSVGGGVGNLSTQYPVVVVGDDVVSRLAADDGGVTLQDMSGGSLLNAYVDVVRYGRI